MRAEVKQDVRVAEVLGVPLADHCTRRMRKFEVSEMNKF